MPIKRQGFLFGGWLSEQGYSHEIFVLAQSRDAAGSLTVSPCMTSGTVPSARAGHAACAVSDKLMAVMGGASGGAEGHLNDLFVLDCETFEWARKEAKADAPAPPGRSRHAMECVGGVLYVFGGADEKDDFGDVWLYHLAESRWSKAATTGPAPGPRWGLTAVAVKKKIYVWGGQRTRPSQSAEETASLQHMYVLDTVTMAWETVASVGPAPIARGGHTCCLFGERFLGFFGGGDGVILCNDCFCFDTLSNEWIQLALGTYSMMLPPRWAHAAVAMDGQMVVSGGANGPISYGEIISVAFDLLVAKAFGEKITGPVDLTTPMLERVLAERPTLSAGPASPHLSRSVTPDEVVNSAAVAAMAVATASLATGLPPLGTPSERFSSPPPTSGSSSPLRQIRGDPIVLWLRSIGGEELIPLFLAENITMRMVPHLTEEHLEELGIASLAGRLTVLSGIAQLRASSSSQAQLSSVTVAVQELTHAIEKMVKQHVLLNKKDSSEV